MHDKDTKSGIIILGRGGHAKVIRDIVESITTYSISCSGRLYVQDMADWDENTRIITGKKYIVGFGALRNLRRRAACFNAIVKGGGIPVTLISPHAVVSPRAQIRPGTVIMPKAVVGPDAIICMNCIINTGAVVEHDAVIGSNVHVSTNAVVNGGCNIFHNCLIGSGAIVKQGTIIYQNNIIGAGAVVVKHITEQGGVYVGVPARKLKSVGE